MGVGSFPNLGKEDTLLSLEFFPGGRGRAGNSQINFKFIVSQGRCTALTFTFSLKRNFDHSWSFHFPLKINKLGT
uniref:Candidate secreted effector n=1 Tax=Meloidogyne incognita TaxID=6306 RepID=A0A914P3Q2_MELIC